MRNVRRASFAGSWYPATASACEKEIRNFLQAPGVEKIPDADCIGGIVPHAGWAFSGDLACRVISAMSGPASQQKPEVVVVFGMHMHPNSTPCIMTKGSWETPFGDIEIESGLARDLAEKFSFTVETTDHFTPENTIELQLPFIKYFFPDSRLIPIGVPPSGKTLEIANSLAKSALEADISLKVIGSTDLTHYGPNYGYAPVGMDKKAVDWVRDHNDRKAIDRMLAMDPEGLIAEGLASQNACCSGAAAAAIAASAVLGAKQGKLAGHSSSYEKHPADSFVGYAGILLC